MFVGNFKDSSFAAAHQGRRQKCGGRQAGEKEVKECCFTTFSQRNEKEKLREPICYPDNHLGVVGTEDVAGGNFAEHKLMQSLQIFCQGMSKKLNTISTFH